MFTTSKFVGPQDLLQSFNNAIMNNSQFRKLVLDTPARQAGSGEGRGAFAATPGRDGAAPSALGSRMRSSIPMTP